MCDPSRQRRTSRSTCRFPPRSSSRTHSTIQCLSPVPTGHKCLAWKVSHRLDATTDSRFPNQAQFADHIALERIEFWKISIFYSSPFWYGGCRAEKNFASKWKSIDRPHSLFCMDEAGKKEEEENMSKYFEILRRMDRECKREKKTHHGYAKCTVQKSDWYCVSRWHTGDAEALRDTHYTQMHDDTSVWYSDTCESWMVGRVLCATSWTIGCALCVETHMSVCMCWPFALPSHAAVCVIIWLCSLHSAHTSKSMYNTPRDL